MVMVYNGGDEGLMDMMVLRSLNDKQLLEKFKIYYRVSLVS